MALRELGARIGCALRSDARPSLIAVRPAGLRNASSSSSVDHIADLEASSSFSTSPLDAAATKTWDPVARHRSRAKPLPASRYVMAQLVSWLQQSLLPAHLPLAFTNGIAAGTSSARPSTISAL